MFTAYDRNDAHDPRIDAFLPRFEKAAAPDPDRNDWESWRALFGATDPSGETRGMSFRMPSGFGTSSSSLLALPSIEATHGPEKKRPRWLFAAGAPDVTPFVAI